MRFTTIALFTGLTFAQSSLSSTAGWAAEDARVLPQGRSRFSFVYGQTGAVKQDFNKDGKAELMTASYKLDNLDLSSSALKGFDPAISDLITFLNETGLHYNVEQRNNEYHGITRDPNDPLLGDSLSRGFLNVDAQGSLSSYNFAYQYGLNERISVGFLLPIVKTKIEIGHKLSGTNTAEDIYAGFVSKDPTVLQSLQEALNFLRSADIETLQSVLVSRGYNRVESTSDSGLGDIALGGRYNYLSQDSRAGHWLNSFQVFTTIPTGRLAPTADLLGMDIGQGAWDVGIAHLTNLSPNGYLTLTQGLHYTHRLPAHRLKRVRTSPTDILPDASTEEDVSMQLGDKYWASVGAKITVTKAVSFDTNYEWFWERADRYEGSRPDRDYGSLSDTIGGRDSHLQTLQFGASISSIPAFLASEFPAPADLSISLNFPTAGKNALIAPYGTAELALYF